MEDELFDPEVTVEPASEKEVTNENSEECGAQTRSDTLEKFAEVRK